MLQRPWIPTIMMLLALGLTGLGLHLWGDAEVFWPGFFAMMVFYAAIFYMGAWAGKRSEGGAFTDLMLAGRKMPLWIAAFTMSATWVGGGFINGSAEYTFSYGLAWVQAPWAYALSLFVGGLLFAAPMRRMRFRTMLDPLRQRFGERMAAMAFFPALLGELFWTSAILTALGATFGVVLGLGFEASILLSAAIAIAYTVLGGLWAVALTDILQMSILLVGLALVIPFALEGMGGWDVAWEQYSETLLFWPDPEHLGDSTWYWWDMALLMVFGGIPWQVYFQRVLSSRDPRTARNLSFLAGLVCLIAVIPSVIIGIIAFGAESQGLFDAAGAPLNLTENPSLALPYVVRYLTHPAVATIGLGAVAAAVMSSVDSSILSAASMGTWNVYKPIFRREASDENLRKVLKRVIWIIGIAATLIALQVQSIYALWALCSDFVYCLLFPLLLTALFDRRANRIGAMAGFFVALAFRVSAGEHLLEIDPLLPWPVGADGIITLPVRTMAMLSGLTTIVVVSRLTARQAPPEDLHVME